MSARAAAAAALEPLGDLLATAPERLPFAPSLAIRAYLLPRARGNLLVYSVAGIRPGAPELEAAGGVARQYLNHRHEALFAPERVAWPVLAHDADRKAIAARVPVRAGFDRRHVLDEDFEAIPTPGHTPGATAYLWTAGDGRRHLFTGDTIYLDRGEWVAAVLGSSDREAYARSLELLREVEFDVLVPWAATAGDEPFAAVASRADARRRIDAILRRVRAGGER